MDITLPDLSTMRLQGDEDGDVALLCDATECWEGGKPLVYYTSTKVSFNCDVPQVNTIDQLIGWAYDHVRTVHDGTMNIGPSRNKTHNTSSQLPKRYRQSGEVQPYEYEYNARYRYSDGDEV